jgi:hypothetical protein
VDGRCLVWATIVGMGRHTELVEGVIAAWHDRDIERIVTFLHPDIRHLNFGEEV